MSSINLIDPFCVHWMRDDEHIEPLKIAHEVDDCRNLWPMSTAEYLRVMTAIGGCLELRVIGRVSKRVAIGESGKGPKRFTQDQVGQHHASPVGKEVANKLCGIYV